VIVTDRVTADLFETTSGGTATSLNFAIGGSDYNNASLHSKLYAVGTQPGAPPTLAAKARFVRYYIADVAWADGTVHPTLMVDRLNGDAPQPVADDIEDMQLSYGLDTNNDGAVARPGAPGEAWPLSPRARSRRSGRSSCISWPGPACPRRAGRKFGRGRGTARRRRRPTGTEGGASR
jgi:hypothetical protein